MKFWGVRGSTPTAQCDHLHFGGNTTCVEVRLASGDLIVIDAGSGLRNLGATLMRDSVQPRVRFLMSHFHWDHIQGLPFFGPLFHPGWSITFHSSIDGSELHDVLRGQMQFPYFPVPFDQTGAQKEFVCVRPEGIRYGDLTIRPFPLHHPQGATGYRLESGGAVIVHASDFEHGNPEADAVLREYARDADVLIYDAQYSPEEYETKRGWGHSTWVEAVSVARDANVSQLVLFHHDPTHDDAVVELLRTEASKSFANTIAAREGSTIRI